MMYGRHQLGNGKSGDSLYHIHHAGPNLVMPKLLSHEAACAMPECTTCHSGQGWVEAESPCRRYSALIPHQSFTSGKYDFTV